MGKKTHCRNFLKIRQNNCIKRQNLIHLTHKYLTAYLFHLVHALQQKTMGELSQFCASKFSFQGNDVFSQESKQNRQNGGAGTAFRPGALELTHGFQQCSCYSIFSFMCSVLQIVVCPFVFFSFSHCVVCPSIYRF